MDINSTPAPAPITTPLLTRISVTDPLENLQHMPDIGLLTAPWLAWVRNVDAVLKLLLAASGGGGDMTGSVLSVTLTADTVITNAAPTGSDGNALLFVFITEDGTGDWTITWGGTFDAATTTDIDLRANETTVYAFVGVGGVWQQFVAPFLRN